MVKVKAMKTQETTVLCIILFINWVKAEYIKYMGILRYLLRCSAVTYVCTEQT